MQERRKAVRDRREDGVQGAVRRQDGHAHEAREDEPQHGQALRERVQKRKDEPLRQQDGLPVEELGLRGRGGGRQGDSNNSKHACARTGGPVRAQTQESR